MYKIESSLCSHRWGYPIVDFGKNLVKTCCRTAQSDSKINWTGQLNSDIFLNNDYQKNDA